MSNQVCRIILAGDLMLGRLVKKAIKSYDPTYPLINVAPMMKRANLNIVNLECAITSSEQQWTGASKAFYFGAPLNAIETLKIANIKLVSLANNHLLDYDYQGLSDTLKQLKEHHIYFAGAGDNLKEARQPAIVDIPGLRIGMVAYCNHQSDFSATKNQPGISYIDLNDQNKVLEEFQRAITELNNNDVDWPILSLHWGPNMVERPSPFFQKIAHSVIEMGYKTLFGHSAHVFQGIEIYKGFPIFYATGDFVDDYYVDEYFKNDHQLLFELIIENKILKKILLYPIFISECQTKFANHEQFNYIVNKMQKLCKEMGTTVNVKDQKYSEIMVNYE